MTSDMTAAIHRLGVWRCAATGAVTLAIVFAVCWIGTLFGQFTWPHMFIALFTSQPVGSGGALAEGLCYSVVFGALTGAVVALSYNLFGFLQRI